MRNLASWRLLVVAVVVTLGLVSVVATGPYLTPISQILGLAWNAEGNAILQLNADIRSGVNVPVDFSQEPYPVNVATDNAFRSKERIDQVMGGSATLQSFALQC